MKKGIKIETAYFEKMKEFIIRELLDGRDAMSIAATIGKSRDTLYDYMRKWNVVDLYREPTTSNSDKKNNTVQSDSDALAIIRGKKNVGKN